MLRSTLQNFQAHMALQRARLVQHEVKSPLTNSGRRFKSNQAGSTGTKIEIPSQCAIKTSQTHVTPRVHANIGARGQQPVHTPHPKSLGFSIPSAHRLVSNHLRKLLTRGRGKSSPTQPSLPSALPESGVPYGQRIPATPRSPRFKNYTEKRQYYTRMLSLVIQRKTNILDHANGNLLMHSLFTLGIATLIFRPSFGFAHTPSSSRFPSLFGTTDENNNDLDSSAPISKSFFHHNHNLPSVTREENVRFLNIFRPLRHNPLFRRLFDGFQQNMIEFFHSNPYLSLILEKVRYPVPDEDDPRQRRLRSLYDILIKPYADKFAQTSLLNILTKRIFTGGFTNMEKLHNNALFYIIFETFIDDEDNTFYNIVFELRRWVLVIVEPLLDFVRKQVIPPTTYAFLRSVDFFMFLDGYEEPDVKSWIYTIVKNRFKNPVLEDEINYFFTNKRRMNTEAYTNELALEIRKEEAQRVYDYNKDAVYSNNPYRTIDDIKGRNLITDSFGIVVDSFLYNVAFNAFVNDNVFNRNKTTYDETIRDWLIAYALEGDEEPFDRFGHPMAEYFGFDPTETEPRAQVVAATLNSDNAYLRDPGFIDFVSRKMQILWDNPGERLKYYNLIKNTLTDDEIKDLYISNTILDLDPMEPREQFRSLIVNTATKYGETHADVVREIKSQIPDAFKVEADIVDAVFGQTPIPEDYHNWNQDTYFPHGYESKVFTEYAIDSQSEQAMNYNLFNEQFDYDPDTSHNLPEDYDFDIDERDRSMLSITHRDSTFDGELNKPGLFRAYAPDDILNDEVDHFAVSMLLLTYIGARIRDMYAIWNTDKQARKDVDKLIKHLDSEVRLLAQTSPEDVERFAKHFTVFEKNLPPYFSREIRPLLLSLSDSPLDPLHKYYRFPVHNRGVGMNLFGNEPMEFSDNPLIDYYYKITLGIGPEYGDKPPREDVARWDFAGDITEQEYLDLLKREQGFTHNEINAFFWGTREPLEEDAFDYIWSHPTTVYLDEPYEEIDDDAQMPIDSEFYWKNAQYGKHRVEEQQSWDLFQFDYDAYSPIGKYFELYNYSLRNALKYISLGVPIVTLFNNIFRPGTIYRHFSVSYENRYKPYSYFTALWGHTSVLAGIFCTTVIASMSDVYLQQWGPSEFYKTILSIGAISNFMGQFTQFSLARLYLALGIQRPSLLAPNGGMWPVVTALVGYTALKYPEGDTMLAPYQQGTPLHYYASYLAMIDLWGAFFLLMGRRTGIPHFANIYGWALGSYLFHRHKENPPARPDVDRLKDWQFEFNIFIEPEEPSDSLRRVQFRDFLETEDQEKEYIQHHKKIDAIVDQEHYMAGMSMLYRFGTSMDFIAQEENLDRLRKMRVEWRRKFADHDYFNIPRGFNEHVYDRIVTPFFNHSARAASKSLYQLQTLIEKAWQIHTGSLLPKDIRKRQFEMHFMFGPLIPEKAVLDQNDPAENHNMTYETMYYFEGLEDEDDFEIEDTLIDDNDMPISEYTRMLNEAYINRTERSQFNTNAGTDFYRLSDAVFANNVPEQAEAGPMSDAFSFRNGLLYDYELQEDLNEDYLDDAAGDHEALQEFIKKHTKSLRSYTWRQNYRHDDVPLDLRIVDEQDRPFKPIGELESTDDWDIETPFYVDGEYNPFESELAPTRVMRWKKMAERPLQLVQNQDLPEHEHRSKYKDYFDFEQSIHDQYGTDISYNDTLKYKFLTRHETPDGDVGMGFSKFSEINRRNDREDRNNARSTESTSIRMARDYLGIVQPDLMEWDIDDWGEDYEWWDYLPFEHHNGLVQLF